ncbi:MAG: GNAT family N-acetyltransferase [Myxococcota bacterium]
MARYQVRHLQPDDYATLMRLEEEVFAADGESVLGPYYVRLVCDFFSQTCFLAFDGDKPVGYILGFMRAGEVYCTTLAVVPDYHGSRVVHLLLRAFCRAVVDTAEVVWFTVKEDNTAARAVHATLGAENVEVRKDFYGPGEDRIVSRLDRKVLERLRERYVRLGFIEAPSSPASQTQPRLEAAS